MFMLVKVTRKNSHNQPYYNSIFHIIDTSDNVVEKYDIFSIFKIMRDKNIKIVGIDPLVDLDRVTTDWLKHAVTNVFNIQEQGMPADSIRCKLLYKIQDLAIQDKALIKLDMMSGKEEGVVFDFHSVETIRKAAITCDCSGHLINLKVCDITMKSNPFYCSPYGAVGYKPLDIDMSNVKSNEFYLRFLNYVICAFMKSMGVYDKDVDRLKNALNTLLVSHKGFICKTVGAINDFTEVYYKYINYCKYGSIKYKTESAVYVYNYIKPKFLTYNKDWLYSRLICYKDAIIERADNYDILKFVYINISSIILVFTAFILDDDFHNFISTYYLFLNLVETTQVPDSFISESEKYMNVMSDVFGVIVGRDYDVIL